MGTPGNPLNRSSRHRVRPPKLAVSGRGELPTPQHDEPRVPIHRRPWVWLMAASAALVLAPVAAIAWNLLRPDAAAPARLREAPSPEGTRLDDALHALSAKLATLRAATISEANARSIRATHIECLHLSRLRRASAKSAPDYDTALAHTATVLAELRADFPRLLPGLASDSALLRELATDALPVPRADALVAHFDATLDDAPDRALALMTGDVPTTEANDASLFERLVSLGRRPNAHRQKIRALHRRFAEALSEVTFTAGIRVLDTDDGDPETLRLATLTLRDATLARLGGDEAVRYFFKPVAMPDRGFEQNILRAATLAKADDAWGAALLLHRRASLARLLARDMHLRFEAAATAYALALEFRKAASPNGGWPKDTEGLFDGLLDTFPLDPFTGEAIAYSRKRLHLRSAGADGVDRGGIDEPEFASNLAQLWEPTLGLEPGAPPSPAAYGLRAADIDKPVPRPWEHPPRR